METAHDERIYLAECLWPDVSREQVHDAARRAQGSAERAARAGTAIRYVGSILVPDDEVVFFQFASSSPADVERVCREAEIAFERVLVSEQVSATMKGEVG